MYSLTEYDYVLPKASIAQQPADERDQSKLLGLDLGFARAVGAISFSIIIGLIMAALFRKEEDQLHQSGELVFPEEERKHPLAQVSVYFGFMVLFLIAASSIGLVVQFDLSGGGEGVVTFTGSWLPALFALIFLVVIAYLVIRWYTGAEVAEWMKETGKLAWKILPILLAGVFVAGILKELLPQETVQKWVGGNTVWNNLLASLFGALMYFSTLTEVPIVKALVELGMGKGPALTLLLAGPSLSLPNMIVIGRVMGFKRTVAYVLVVIVLSTLGGMIFGMIE